MHISVMNKKIFVTILFFLFVLLINAKEKPKFTVFSTESKMIFDFCFFENGEKLAVADNTTIKIFSTNSQQLLGELSCGHSEKILTIDVSKDNRLLASGGEDGKIVILAILEKSTIKNILIKDDIVTSVNFSPDSRYLLVGTSKGNVFVYDIENDTKSFNYSDHKKDVTSVKFSPDGKLFASSSGDKTINIYQTKDGKLISTLKGHRNWVREIIFNQDGQKLLSCGDDSKVIFWDLSNLTNISSNKKTYKTFNWITSLDLYKDDKSYVFGRINGRITIKTSINNYQIKLNKAVNKIRFVPTEIDYIKVVAATNGNGLILIDAQNMKLTTR